MTMLLLALALGAASGGPPPANMMVNQEWPKGTDVKVPITDGSMVEVKTVLAKGKYTIVDFYADWCGPCRRLDMEFSKMLPKRKNVALRKLNIVNWNSALAKGYQLQSIPYCRLYSPKGEFLAEFRGSNAVPDIEARIDARKKK